MQRETKTLTTPEGKELVIKTFMNAKERNAIKSAFLEGIKIDPNNIAKKENGEILQECDASIMLRAEKRMFDQLIISYAGSPDDLADRIEQASPKEYDFVVDELNKITTGNFEKAK